MDEMVVLLIPLLGTTLGAAMVFFMKDNINAKIEKTLLGFAAGVMIGRQAYGHFLFRQLICLRNRGE